MRNTFKNSLAVLILGVFLVGCSGQTVQNGANSSSQAQAQAKPQTPLEQLMSGPVKNCTDETDQVKLYSCFETFLQNDVKTGGSELAFQDLKLLYEAVPSVKTYCHPFAHVIGRAAIGKYATLAEAYQHGDSYCWSGYYHGAMEQISTNIGRENLPAQLDKICQDMPGKENYSFDYYNCVHGLGHGVMAVTKNQLFESLKLCDNMTGQWEKQSCYSGVFMENVIVDNLNHHTDYLKPDQPLYPCTAVEEQYKLPCYLMQTSYMLKINSYNFKEVFGQCEKADKGFVDTCYQSLGRDASGSSVSDVTRTHATCVLGKNYDQKSNCMIGAVKDFVSYFHSDVQAKQFCNSFTEEGVSAVPETEGQKLTTLCLQTSADYYKNF